MGDGTGSFPTPYSITPTGDAANTCGCLTRFVALGDFTGDGYIDILLTSLSGSHATGGVDLLVNPSGLSSTWTTIPAHREMWIHIPIIADLDNDGHLDAVVSTLEGPGFGSRNLRFMGDGSGSFTVHDLIPFGTRYWGYAAALADVRSCTMHTAHCTLRPADERSCLSVPTGKHGCSLLACGVQGAGCCLCVHPFVARMRMRCPFRHLCHSSTETVSSTFFWASWQLTTTFTTMTATAIFLPQRSQLSPAFPHPTKAHFTLLSAT